MRNLLLLSGFECDMKRGTADVYAVTLDLTHSHMTLSGGDGGEATPVPMPNTAVKLSSADGSWTDVPQE